MAQTKIANNQLQLDVSKNYTQDNLVAGKSIELAEYINPYIIDSNTLLCCHFDNNLKDEVSGENLTISREFGYSTITGQYKFDSSLVAMNSSSGSIQLITFPSQLILGSNWTIDFWCNSIRGNFTFRNDDDTTQIAICDDSSRFQSTRVIKGPNCGTNYLAEVDRYTGSTLHHIAFCYKQDDKLYYFVDGHIKKTLTLNCSGMTLNSLRSEINEQYWNTLSTIDELRISNVCRWTEDFEVPDAPYEAASGSNPMAINTIVDTALSSTSKNPVQNKIINAALDGKQAALTTATGYDATKTQVLKNINGVLTWVDEA